MNDTHHKSSVVVVDVAELLQDRGVDPMRVIDSKVNGEGQLAVHVEGETKCNFEGCNEPLGENTGVWCVGHYDQWENE